MQRIHSALAAVAMAALLVLAGCAGPVSNGPGTDLAGSTPENVDVSDGGTVSFYISDEENAIDDFEHLNVTITAVGLHRTGDAGSGATPTGTATAATGTATADAAETATATPATPAGTATASPVATATPEADEEAEAEETEDRESEDEEDDDDAEGEGDAEWVEYEVNRTVDLTELKGANATKLDVLAAPDGTYDKVFVYVDGIDATLDDGTSVNVKLPSSKLQINKRFTVGDGQNVSFVFDLAVHRAGKSGKYILRPVISQSGTGDEVDIEDVDEREDDEEKEEEADDEEHEDENETAEPEEAETDEGSLTAEFQGPVRAGQDATLKVTGDDGPVANATVAVDGETVGTTDAAGTLTFAVPEDAEELEVEVTKGEAEFELEADVTRGGGALLRALR